MDVIWVSFRISEKTVNGRDYDSRYKALIDVLGGFLVGRAWEDTTSFVVMRTNATPRAVANAVKLAIAPAEDTVLIGAPEKKGVILVGSSPDFGVLQSLIPGAMI